MNKLVEEVQRFMDGVEGELNDNLDPDFTKVEITGGGFSIGNEEELANVESWAQYTDDILEYIQDQFKTAKGPVLEATQYADQRRRDMAERFETVKERLRTSIYEYLMTGAESENYTLRGRWGYKVTDFPALVQAVADGEAPESLLQVNEKFARETVNTLKDAMQYPGIEAVPDPVLVKTPAKESKEQMPDEQGAV